MSQAALTTACSTCRLPITGPQRRVIAACAASNEPRTASTAASRARAWDGRQAGSDSAASAGHRLGAPGRRQAHRVTCTVPNSVASSLPWPVSTRFRVIPSAPVAGT